MRYRLKLWGTNDDGVYHFSDPRDLAEFLLSQKGIVEVSVNEV